MQEIIEQVLDYLKGIWIKRRYLMISTWIICPIGWLFIAQLDDVYESEAIVFADTQSILGPLLKGITVETNTEAQIQLMVKTLLSRSNLERITRMTDFDVRVKNDKEYELLIDSLKEDIIIKKTGGKRQNIFKISFEDKDPEMARDVVQAVLTVFIETTIGENRNDSDSAQKFLTTQINEYESRLLAAENRLTDFKQKYNDVLPNQYGGYYQKLTVAKEQLKGIELGLLETQTQLKSAKAQLPDKNTEKSQAPDSIKNNNSIETTYDERITELETSLDSLLVRYTEKHPDIIEIKNRLAHLKKQRSDEIDKYLETSTDENANYSLSQSPVTQGILMQINQLENQVASFTVRAENYRKEVADLESKIHILPEIEAELVALNRGYNITKEKYEELLTRRETAQLAKQADDSNSKIKFNVIEPPRAPAEPTGPKRILLTIVMLFLGLGAGTALSLLVSQINPVVTSGSQVSRLTGIPIFGVVSASEHLGLQKWHKKKTLIFIISNILLLILLAAFLAYALYPEAIKAPLRRIF
ncbi:XrtA system polysaccharide chain length determinant [Pseudocolwellia agarivorans]|uniref:XrtA system polysaccharide chain length determinant n=1 Tax=Pseudocolwellia agarivorans TaxID=1911682 RepID=UPI00098739FA|nr:XrtA system polysaccharide chain length determinant [Pseudocolwellia agarivorans]